jgi:hypothetical protein
VFGPVSSVFDFLTFYVLLYLFGAGEALFQKGLSGKIEHVVLGVGAFLGMGEHYVAVSFDKLKWVNEAVRSTSVSSAPTTTTEKTTTGTTAATTTTTTKQVRAANEQWYPDHVVFNATKDQLKAMPQFKYN